MSGWPERAKASEQVNSERTRHIQVPPSSRVVKAQGTEEAAKTVRISDVESSGEVAESGGTNGNTDLYDLYAIQSKIGDGGMGVVYLARDRRLDRFVAIKRLNHAAQNNAALRRRFLHEARAAAALSHIHIVHIYVLGEDSEGPYIVMEYVAGPGAATGSREALNDGQPAAPLSLDRQVSNEGQYTVNEAIELLVKISKAIAYAHANGVIHRDLKPANILIDRTGEPKVVDFGLARLMSEGESKLTGPGEKLLSLGYGAPEQEHDASVADHRADIYGLGALLYFAITGQNPRYFREQDIPLALREVLVKALATDREQRWDSVGDFLEALRAVQTRTRVEQPTTKTTWRCKWCDTVNPLTIRFCSECGWDGSETCPECGAERFVGEQYCGACGTDARIYETIALLARRMRGAAEAAEFERVIAFAGRAQGFEPVGPTGRALLKSIQQERDQAQSRLARRDQLKGLIPLEMRAENYERATAFIAEFRKLSGNPQLFSDLEQEMPALQVKRDLKHARRACQDGEWRYAIQLCDRLLEGVAPDNPDCLALRRTILRRRSLRRCSAMVASSVGVVALYLLLLPLLAHLAGRPLPRPWRVLWSPAGRLFASPRLGQPLRAYARLWQIDDVAPLFAAPLPAVAVEPTAPAATGEPSELVALAQGYSEQLHEVDEERQRYDESWPEQYLLELETLMERRRVAGDYEAWSAINAELSDFREERHIGRPDPEEPGELAALKRKYRSQSEGMRIEHARRIVAATRKYLSDLTTLQSGYTKDARMVEAARINGEIKRVREMQAYLEAKEIVAEYAARGEDEKPVTPPPEEHVAELAPLRQGYEERLSTVEAEFTRQQEEWPEEYLTGLGRLLQQFQNAGDFAGWSAVKDEIDRFEIDRLLLPGHIVLTPPLLLEAQQQQLQRLSDSRARRARAIINLSEGQLKELDALQRRFTKAGDMEAAGAVNTEMRRLRNAPELVAAQNELNAVPQEAGEG